MSHRTGLLSALLMLAGLALPGQMALAQAPKGPGAGCAALNKGKPPLYISYQGPEEKAWAGDKYEKGVLLRLRNNSSCAILLEAIPGQASSLRVRDGKLVRLDMEEAKDGQKLDLRYLMKYPGQGEVDRGAVMHLLDYARLRVGDSVLFSVPLSNFRKGGELLVPYVFEPGGGLNYGAKPPAEQRLSFGRRPIPLKLLR